MSSIPIGPTAYEAACARLIAIKRAMSDLEQEKRQVLARIEQFAGSSVSEAERLATAAEPFQQHTLPSLREQFGNYDHEVSLNPEQCNLHQDPDTLPTPIEPVEVPDSGVFANVADSAVVPFPEMQGEATIPSVDLDTPVTRRDLFERCDCLHLWSDDMNGADLPDLLFTLAKVAPVKTRRLRELLRSYNRRASS